MTPADTPLFIGSEIYRGSSYGAGHPLAVPRVSTVIDLCRALGWLPSERFLEAPMATPAQVTRFHDPAYVEALRRAEAGEALDAGERERFGLGVRGNPVFAEICRRPMTSAGGVLLAASRAAPGRAVFCPGGGTHHGQPGRASGFCYLNDCVLGLLAWLDSGLDRVAYIDIDAHHPDGVQDALGGDPRLLLISLHEAGRWPFTGAADDRGAAGGVRNLPLPPGGRDADALFLLRAVVLPLLDRFRPRAILLQAGADALAEDPLSRLCWTNAVHLAFARALLALPWRPALVVVGGGGYNPWSVARCWTAIWGAIIGAPPPAKLPDAAERVLRALRWDRAAGRNPPPHWFTTLLDPPEAAGSPTQAALHLAATAMEDRA